MSTLEHIITKGNRPPLGRGAQGGCEYGPNKITCADGFTVSVIAGEGTYCSPRPDSYGGMGDAHAGFAGPFTAVEVGFPSVKPEPWDEWEKFGDGDESAPTENVYGYVPVDLVRALIASHGGER